MQPLKILYLTDTVPDPAAGGWARRIHQVIHELRACYGPDSVVVLSLREIQRPRGFVARQWVRARFTARRWRDNPFQMAVRERYAARYFTAADRRAYEDRLRALGDVSLCIFEQTNFHALAAINARLGIRTIAAPWAFESTTMYLAGVVEAVDALRSRRPAPADRLVLRSAFTSLANELAMDASFDGVWFLSQVESGLFQACGLPAGYFPYYPAGEARELLQAVARRRRPERDLLLVTGSSNAQNMKGLATLLRDLTSGERKSAPRIVVTGVEQSAARFDTAIPSGVHFAGRVDDAEFTRLLESARAVLIPQVCGFGCMTRVTDMLCAGIPVVADSIVANAIGRPPGAEFVARGEGQWSRACEGLLKSEGEVPREEFAAWLREQESLARVLVEEAKGR